MITHCKYVWGTFYVLVIVKGLHLYATACYEFNRIRTNNDWALYMGQLFSCNVYSLNLHNILVFGFSRDRETIGYINVDRYRYR